MYSQREKERERVVIEQVIIADFFPRDLIRPALFLGRFPNLVSGCKCVCLVASGVSLKESEKRRKKGGDEISLSPQRKNNLLTRNGKEKHFLFHCLNMYIPIYTG